MKLFSFLNYKYTLLFFTFFITSLLNSQQLISNKLRTIVLDAGHGGKDPGARGSSSNEKDIALSVVKKLSSVLKSKYKDLNVILTREDDVFIPLHERANIANKAKADFFLSIHLNSSTKKEPNGVELYVLGLHKSEENLLLAKKENEVVSLEGNITENYGFDPNSTEGNIILTMKQSQYLDNSISFAKKLEAEFINSSFQIVRGAKQAGFVVLYQTTMPSCLAEIGFISNSKEEEFMMSEEGQNDIVNKLESGISAYKQKLESEQKDELKLGSKPKNSLITKISEDSESIYNKVDSKNNKIFNTSQNAARQKPSSLKTNNESEKVNETESKKILILQDEEELERELMKKKKNLKKSTLSVSNNEIQNNVSESSKRKSELVIETQNNTSEKIEKLENLEKLKVDDVPTSTLSASNTKPVIISDIEDINIKMDSFKKKKIDNDISFEKKKIIIEQNLNDEIEFKNSKETIKTNANNTLQKTETKVSKTKMSIEDGITKPEKVSTTLSSNFSRIDKKTNINTDNNNDIIYYVQIKASKVKLSSDDNLYSSFPDIVEKFEDDMYKYICEKSFSIAQIRLSKEKVVNKGIVDAFIVKYQNGNRMK